MTEPIPPVREIVVGPVELANSRREMAEYSIRDEGFPHSAAEQREVFEDARRLINESFTRRGIPTPAGGWTLGLVPPWEPWQEHIAPELAARLVAELPEHPPTAAVVVVLALDLSGKGRP
jgi:hypothetical protein